ncbi:MAG: putative baseplate assembly protein [Paracoccaceae bacterium]
MSGATEPLCGCCGGLAALTPRANFERAGLSRISARTGTYWSFYDTMVSRLTSAEYGALGDLRTRDASIDFSIAMLDAWAVTGDVLTFYNERLVSETLLQTAGELWSLHRLADLVGYAPHPGVSATSNLAFQMATTEGAPRTVQLPSGIKVQSTPGPDETPVIFETSESIQARPAWNAMRPRLTSVQTLSTTTTRLFLSGTTTGLMPGDALFFEADDATAVFAIIRLVEIQTANIAEDPDSVDLTRLTVDPISTAPVTQNASQPPLAAAPVFPPEIAPHIGSTVTASELTELLEDSGLAEQDLFDVVEGIPETPKRILVFRANAGCFGNSAIPISKLPPAMTVDAPIYSLDDDTVIISGINYAPYRGVSAANWADGDLTVLQDGANAVHLDRVVKEITSSGYAAIVEGNTWGVYSVDAVDEVSLAEFAITGKSTRLELNTDTGFGGFSTRNATVFAESEWIDLPRKPRNDAIRSGDTVVDLHNWAPGLSKDQKLFLTGIFADGLDAPVTRLVELSEVQHQLFAGGSTRLTFSAALIDDFDRRALRINGNVAASDHGETVEEILASGDPTRPFLSAAAKQKPLTHVSSTAPGGALAAAEIRVGGIKWDPVHDLLDAQSHDRVYTISIDTEGGATFGFGNGIQGAMPTAGQDNITATYRKGIGLDGRVNAGQLNILMTRPLGVEAVINPHASEGGADPEPLDAVRTNVPLSCRTLGRVVSLSDFADFSRAYAGIAKARAEWVKLPGAAKAGVVVTVAGEKAAEVLPHSNLHSKLTAALRENGIPYTRFRLKSYRPKFFRIGALIKVDPAYLPDVVLPNVEATLRTTFSFASQNFGEAVFASDVIATMQNVDGVEAVILDRFYRGAVVKRNDILPAAQATPTQGAELLMLHPEPLDFLELLS